jgi:site-specific recombinase XerD
MLVWNAVPGEISCAVGRGEGVAAAIARRCAKDSDAWRGQSGGVNAHPHMLRHACGFALANKGHDTRSLQAYLGHKNIQHTVRYTELAPTKFKDFWR